MGEFTEALAKEARRNYEYSDGQALLAAQVARVGEKARLINREPGIEITDEQVGLIIKGVGSFWREQAYPYKAHLDLHSISQHLNWHFDEKHGAVFPDLTEQPILLAAALEGRNLTTIAEYGLTRFPNVNRAAVATILLSQFTDDLREGTELEYPYPFFPARRERSLADVLPDRELYEWIGLSALDNTLGVYEMLPPPQREEWRLRKGQSVAELLLRRPELLSDEAIRQVEEYAATSPQYVS